MRLPARVVCRMRARAAGDGGISLIEVIVAMMIIGVVMSSAAGFFLKSLKTTGGAAGRQTAVDVVNQEMENIRAVPGSSLLTGRTQAEVVSLLAWSGAAQLTAHDDITGAGGVQNYDPQATTAGGESVPTVTTQTVNNQQFTLRNFINPCWLPVGTAQDANTQNLACGADPTPPAGTKSTDLFRVTVAASWTGGAATGCTHGCTYSASSLVDPHHDATYQSNITHPTITGLSPSSIAAGATKTITVNGSGFVYGATVTTCSNATVVSVNQQSITDTMLQVTVTASSTTGSCYLQVTNPDGGNTGSGTTFAIDVPPAITTVSPTVQNYTTKTVTITGTNYANPAVSPASGTWNNTAYQGTTGITGSYTANAPAAGSVPVTVTNPDGGQATGTITVTKSTPQLTLVTSSTIAAGSSSTVTMTGTDLAPSGATLTVSAGTPSNVSTSGGTVSFTYTAPSGAGSASFTVTNPDGGSATVTVSVVVVSPTISSVQATTTYTCSQWSYSYYWGWYCSSYQYTTTYTVTGNNFGTSPTVALSFNGGSYATVSTSGSSTTRSFSQTYTSNPGGRSFGIKVTVNGNSVSKTGTVTGP